MPDYVEILDTQIEPDAPLTSTLAAQWRDNHLAVAEGATDAPRNMPLSLNLRLGDPFEVAATSPFSVVTGLAGLNSLIVVAAVAVTTAGGTVSLDIDASLDNGATWEDEWFPLISATSEPGSPANNSDMFHLSLSDWRVNMRQIAAIGPVTAIRFRRNAGAAFSARVAVYGFGRT